MKRSLAALLAVGGLAFGVATSAQAASLVTNGDFESTTAGPGQLGYNTDATGWTTTGYNFLFASGTADTTGSSGQYGGLLLWGPNNGSANGLPASSPDGGNFIGADGDFQVGAIQQTINGLTVGATYDVGFWYAFAQQSSFDGDTVQHWSVSLGSQTQTTADYALASHGFSGWQHQDYSFTADNTSDILSFLAYGNVPVPPFALLDGVSMTAVPEPATWAVVIAGIAGLYGAARLRRARGAMATDIGTANWTDQSQAAAIPLA